MGGPEAAVIAAVAPEVGAAIAPEAAALFGGGMAAGEGLGMLTAGEAASLLAPEAAGWAIGAGESLGGGLGAAFGMPEASASTSGLTAAYLPSQVFSPLSTADVMTSLATPLTSAMPGIKSGMLTAPVTPFAPGAVTPASGIVSAFGPVAKGAAEVPWLTGDRALQLAKMVGSMSDSGEQRPMGSPPDFSNPQQRPGLLTQEQITKKWLLENDPQTYRRLYGEPRGVM